jgi:hypothetical protein
MMLFWGFGKVAEGLLDQSGLRLVAVALAIVVRADIDSVQAGAMHRKPLAQVGVHPVKVLLRVEAQCHATLVGHHNYLTA